MGAFFNFYLIVQYAKFPASYSNLSSFLLCAGEHTVVVRIGCDSSANIDYYTAPAIAFGLSCGQAIQSFMTVLSCITVTIPVFP